MSERIRWSKLFEYRVKIHDRYPDIWDLKIVRKRLPFILKHVADGDKILEIGASARDLEMRIKEHLPHILYRSMDIDREGTHDYYSLDDVGEKFDVILLFEVIEHLDLDDGIAMLQRIYSLLNPGGRFILSTPNTFKPGQFWRDVTHKVAYCYDELGGLLLSQNFKIEGMYRNYNDAFHRYLFRIYIVSPLHRLLRIDYAKSIFIVAER